MVKTLDDTDPFFNHSRRVQFQQLPPLKESSIESIDSTNGGAPLATFDPSDPFAALRSKSKSANNSPSASSDHSSSIRHASQISEPSGLQSAVQRAKFNLALKKLAGSTHSSTPKLDPSTAEFRPAAALQAPAMHTQQTSLGDSQAQDNAAIGLNAFQPQRGESFEGVNPINSPGPNTFAPYAGNVASQTSNGTPHQYTTFPAQIGGVQSQSQVPFPKNNGMAMANGMALQPVRSNVNGTIGVTYMSPNGYNPDYQRQQQQQQQYISTNGMAFAVPNGNGVQYDVNNMSQALVARDGNAPQQHVNTNEIAFGMSNGNAAQHVNNMNGLNGTNFGTEYDNVSQQHGSGVRGFNAVSPSAMNCMPNGARAMAPVADGSNGNSFEQMSMSTLQAHLDLGSQYPQAQPSPKHTFPQGAARSAQYSNQSLPFQPQNNVVMQQQQQAATTPVRSVAGSPYGQSTPAPPASVYSSPGATTTRAQHMVSPSYRGRTDPRSYDARANVSTEPPPRFDLHTPVPVHQQVYNSVISPSSAGGPFSPRGATASPGHSSSNNSVMDPFNGPALSSVIQPIEPQSAMVLHESAVPVQIRNMRSKQLNELTAGPTGRPRPEAALDASNFPFLESARNAQPTTHCGVVKLKNIPFGTKRAEVLAFLGRNSKVLNDNQEPVHIIMERVTSKTNDAYVEFMSMQAAVNAVEKHQKTVANGRLSRLGDRPIEVELSSQAALMKDLFPLAKGVRWEGAVPVVLEDHPSEPWNCFKGFVSDEEMAMLVKHVEVPQRSPFSRDCPQRPFECMISTLRKLPWYKTDCITIKQRHSVYSACIQLIRLLQHAIKEKKDEEHLTSQLLKRLWTSAMLCHGFTVTMRDNIAYQVDIPEDRLREFNMPRFANMWVHAYTLCPKPGTPLDVLEYYIALIREETNRTVGLQQPNIQSQIHNEGTQTNLYWGFFFKELNLPHGPAFDNMTLAQMAELEFRALTNILTRALA
ncbi:hypothetical protein INS49_003516 [Diaporthe citri]|uniref:uncharacterized protein n=1 Tax=Diaporthe citri TaxID=83186 RepID=UPI001C7FDB14|nr:uncharacterized protein INS49_003516 [Diaporthe citri]KAG6355554.1 hypothetical protein INS49_003516 [Diaporthe citri]